MSPRNAERRPHEGAASAAMIHDPATATRPESAPILPAAADLVNGVFVLVVTVPGDPEPRRRRRVFMQAQSAQRAADRAVERGHRAEVVLCRLIPEVYAAEGVTA